MFALIALVIFGILLYLKLSDKKNYSWWVVCSPFLALIVWYVILLLGSAVLLYILA